jgi:hypothetical protein
VRTNTMYIMLRGVLPPSIRAGLAGAFVSGVSCGNGNKKQLYFLLGNEALCLFSLLLFYSYRVLWHALGSRALHTSACRSANHSNGASSWYATNGDLNAWTVAPLTDHWNYTPRLALSCLAAYHRPNGNSREWSR